MEAVAKFSTGDVGADRSAEECSGGLLLRGAAAAMQCALGEMTMPTLIRLAHSAPVVLRSLPSGSRSHQKRAERGFGPAGADGIRGLHISRIRVGTVTTPRGRNQKKNKINKKGCSRFISESSIRWERRGRVGDVATASRHQTCLSPMSPATLTDEGVTKNKRAHPASTVGVRTSTPGGTCLENALARATFHKSRVDATRLCLGHRDPDVSTRI